MGDNTKIEYLDSTWSPLKGCCTWRNGHRTKGCVHCWAERQAARFAKPGEVFHGLTENGSWNGQVKLYPHELIKPVWWTRPRRIGVSFMGDMFCPNARWEDQAAAFGAMLMSPQHQFLLLTKDPQGMTNFIDLLDRPSLRTALDEMLIDPELLPAQLCVVMANRKTAEPRFDYRKLEDTTFPPKNVWFGASIEDQGMANRRLSQLKAVPAYRRWISIEPLLRPVSLKAADPSQWLHYVVVGGESGQGYRPMDPDWARALRTECRSYGIPFYLKQMAGKRPIPEDLMVRMLPPELHNITTPNTKAQNHGRNKGEGRA